MQRAVVLLAILACPAVLSAQQPPSTVPALPPIGLPLPQIGLPLSPIVPPFAQSPSRKPAPAEPGRRGGRDGQRDRRRSHSIPLVVYVPGPYTSVYERHEEATGKTRTVTPSADEPRAQTGWLDVRVEPADAQVFVDGAYVGTPADEAFALSTGIHRLEIRAPGFEPIAVDVAIAAERRTTYRTPLTTAAPSPARSPTRSPAAVPVDRPRRTVYLLKGCYIGDAPPAPGSPPARCDIGRMTTYTTDEQ